LASLDSPFARTLAALQAVQSEFANVELNADMIVALLQSICSSSSSGGDSSGGSGDLAIAMSVFERAFAARLLTPATMAVMFHALARAGQVRSRIRDSFCM
jgi:hypothetical protein